MFLGYDEQGRIHWIEGQAALCGCRNIIETVHHDLDGTERKCKACEKAKKRRDRVSAVGQPVSHA